MFTAEMAMTKDVITVKSATPIYDAMKVLVDNDITGLPVVDDDMKLLGIISEKDMLDLLYNSTIGEKTVGDLMTKDVKGFNKDDDLVDICDCLIDNAFRRVPVLADGKLAGIISRRDIIKFILKVRKND